MGLFSKLILTAAFVPVAAFATRPTVIYGTDDRLEYYEVSDPAVQALADSTVALVHTNLLQPMGDTTRLVTSDYGRSLGLCSSERFYDQPLLGYCSGSLIAPDIVLTAGHCVARQLDCTTVKFVFGYKINTSGKLPPDSVPSSQVYSCRELIYSKTDSRIDFALIRLDRPVTSTAPLAFRTKGQVAVGDSLQVIGYPLGLPEKIAGGANVRAIHDGFFSANLDTYGGNSGSPVFNAHTGVIEGVLNRGETDFVVRGTCRISKVCADNECRGEEVTPMSEILPYLPGTTHPRS